MSIRLLFILIGAFVLAAMAVVSIWFMPVWWGLVLLIPLLALALYDILQPHRAILRNFPLLGHFRYLFELISPEIQQYFIERNTDGTPISQNHRNLVYGRGRNESVTHPFGTELDLYNPRYNGLRHSMYPVKPLEEAPRVRIGGPDCKQPYEASLLNISAMSFGALSSRAILAMGHGAKAGGFYHNTGEGSLSKYHLETGADIVWEIGTAYFGCRSKDGGFDPEQFKKTSRLEVVKMIELKLSQGAKPGHGGVLPAAKNNEEIAAARGIEPHTDVISPPGHREFSDSDGLLEFIQRLRDLSGGKPTGFKFCLGRREEFTELCEAMVRRKIYPDFITIDGAEGGTGAAPLEYSDSVGMPLYPALEFIHQALQERGLRKQIRLIASGKIFTAADLVRVLAQGADVANAARAFMLTVGCIQAQRCDTNNCPTGVATQKESLVRGLDVEDKRHRVEHFQHRTLEAALELMAACGVSHPNELNPTIFLARDGDASPNPSPIHHGPGSPNPS